MFFAKTAKRGAFMNLLGIDFGTTSLKAAVFNEQGELLSSVSRDYTLNAKDDRVEFDAEQYWDICRTAIEQVSSGFKIDALAIDTQCETMVLADEYGNPLYPAIVWLDNRAVREAKDIEAHFGRKTVYETTGQAEIMPTWPACKLLWVRRNLPDVWSKVKKIFLLEDYLLYRMTGQFVTQKTLQSSTIYFDIHKAVWWQEMLDYIGITEDMLPKLKNSAEIVGEYKGITVVTGAMDQIAGAIGSGTVKKGVVSETTGTALVVFVPEIDMPDFDSSSVIPCHYNYNGNYCLLPWTPTAGMALKWFKNNIYNVGYDELDRMAQTVDAGCNGLVFLPHLCGSTMPRYNPDARGAFCGLTLEHTKAHMVRSIMESVACILKENLDHLGMDIHEIHAMGGGASSPLWCRIMADITGKKMVTLKNGETACLGSAILAGVGIGLFPSVEQACSDLVKAGQVYMPSGEDTTAIYENYLKYSDMILGGR